MGIVVVFRVGMAVLDVFLEEDWGAVDDEGVVADAESELAAARDAVRVVLGLLLVAG